MKKVLFAAVLVCLFIGTAFAGRQDFELQNYSGKTIVKVYVSPSYLDNYKPQHQFTGGGLPLKSGRSTTLRFNNGEDKNTRYWDMLVIFEDDDHMQYRRLDLIDIYSITIDGRGEIFTKR